MIKRLFYNLEHGDKDEPSDSSSSDSQVEAEDTEESQEEVEKEEEEEQGFVTVARGYSDASSSSSGYESEDSSANEVNIDTSGLPTNSDDTGVENEEKDITENLPSGKGNSKVVDSQSDTMVKIDPIPSDVASCILKRKSVFKCKLCPRIVCLTEETLNAHLKSKRHARSAKLLSEGRLKLMLNSDGEIEGENVEKPAQTVASIQDSANSGKKRKGQFGQRKRFKKRIGAYTTRKFSNNQANKRRGSDS